MSRTKFFWISLISITLGTCIAAGVAFWHRYNPPALPKTNQPSATDTTPPTPTTQPTSSDSNNSSNTTTPTTDTPPTPTNTDTSPQDLLLQKPPEITVDNNQKSPIAETPQTLPSKSKDSYLPLSKVSCEQYCKQYSEKVELRYCQEYCGLAEPMTENNCDSLKNLERDYCYKDQALAKTDPSLCKKIDDHNIKTSCQNRLTEAIVDQSRSSTPIGE